MLDELEGYLEQAEALATESPCLTGPHTRGREAEPVGSRSPVGDPQSPTRGALTQASANERSQGRQGGCQFGALLGPDSVEMTARQGEP